MRYIWHRIADPIMHIQRHDKSGDQTPEGLCGKEFQDGFGSINAPYTMGRQVCTHCEVIAKATP